MMVELNGRPTEVAENASVADAVVAAGIATAKRGIAAAVNGEVVPRSEWESVMLAEGAQVEVVQAVQGG